MQVDYIFYKREPTQWDLVDNWICQITELDGKKRTWAIEGAISKFEDDVNVEKAKTEIINETFDKFHADVMKELKE